jgi:hypothetical protein
MSGSSPPPSGPRGLPIGISEFTKLRRAGLRYVDKTDFVAGVVEASAEVLLFPRPRRFGKTLNLSTLRCFIEKTDEDVRPLFAGLAIEQRAGAWEHFQRYPVIFMTFKDVKASTFPGALQGIQRQIRAAYRQHRYLLEGDALDPQEKDEFLQILRKEADEDTGIGALLALSGYLHRHHGAPVAVLIDEYDTPIHTGFSSGYYERVVEFFRAFLGAGLKDNPHLWKGVLTGILRVARESIFSGLNNLAVYTVLRPAFSDSFGFTPEEVASLARDVGREAALPDMERWYNGYRFAEQLIYNPWSVLSFLASEDLALRPYWIASGSHEIVRDLLLSRAGDAEGELETLIRGKSITKTIDENVSLRDLPPGSDSVWGFLLFTGYLTATRVRHQGGLVKVRLRIPNREVRAAFRTVFKTWLSQALGDGARVRQLVQALVAGDAETAEELLGRLTAESLSHHDTGRGPGEPERVYHAFVLGLLVWLGPRYRVWSNRESGHGRCDVMLVPKAIGEVGVVLELKVVDKRRGETPAKAMTAALRQIRERGYSTDLLALGARGVREIGVVFEGKRVRVGVAGQRRGASGGR